MRKINLLIALIALLVFHTVAFTQDILPGVLDTSTSSYFKIGVDYISNNVYLGRKDSANIPYVTPTIGYYHRSGLFIEGSLSLVPTANVHVDLIAIAGGYDFHSKDEKFTGELYGAKYFFTDSSNSVRSEIKGEVDAIAAYDFGPVSINGGAAVLFSKPADLMFNAGLSHAFDFGNNYEWSVTPTFSANIGSLNFYKDYYRNRKFKRRRGVRQITVSGTNNFSILNYEFSVPLTYDVHKWSFLISPYYSIPVNPVQYSVNGIFVKQEQLSNSFYFEASASLEF